MAPDQLILDHPMHVTERTRDSNLGSSDQVFQDGQHHYNPDPMSGQPMQLELPGSHEEEVDAPGFNTMLVAFTDGGPVGTYIYSRTVAQICIYRAVSVPVRECPFNHDPIILIKAML